MGSFQSCFQSGLSDYPCFFSFLLSLLCPLLIPLLYLLSLIFSFFSSFSFSSSSSYSSSSFSSSYSFSYSSSSSSSSSFSSYSSPLSFTICLLLLFFLLFFPVFFLLSFLPLFRAPFQPKAVKPRARLSISIPVFPAVVPAGNAPLSLHIPDLEPGEHHDLWMTAATAAGEGPRGNSDSVCLESKERLPGQPLDPLFHTLGMVFLLLCNRWSSPSTLKALDCWRFVVSADFEMCRLFLCL